MKLLVKLFIYWTIIVIVGVFNNMAVTEAKPRGGMRGLMKMQEPPQQAPAMESSIRGRRNVQTDDVPKELQQNPEQTRAKRQMPPPPPGSENIPMPPM